MPIQSPFIKYQLLAAAVHRPYACRSSRSTIETCGVTLPIWSIPILRRFGVFIVLTIRAPTRDEVWRKRRYTSLLVVGLGLAVAFIVVGPTAITVYMKTPAPVHLGFAVPTPPQPMFPSFIVSIYGSSDTDQPKYIIQRQKLVVRCHIFYWGKFKPEPNWAHTDTVQYRHNGEAREGRSCVVIRLEKRIAGPFPCGSHVCDVKGDSVKNMKTENEHKQPLVENCIWSSRNG